MAPLQAQALMQSVGATLVDSTVALGVELWQVHGLSLEETCARLTASGQVAYAIPTTWPKRRTSP